VAQADRLNIFTRTVKVADLDSETLVESLRSHRAVQDKKVFRERTVFVFGDEAAANDLYFELAASIRKIEEGADDIDDDDIAGVTETTEGGVIKAGSAPAPLRASERWKDATVMLSELQLEQYTPQFEEEEMTSMQLLEDIVNRSDGEKELMEALKEMGIKKMGHRQTIVNAVLGKL